MKKIVMLFVLSVFVILTGCVSNQSKQRVMLYQQNLSSMTPCPAERPIICTMEHNPTCGIYADGSMSPVDYSSGCVACSRKSIAGYIDGSCAAIQLNQPEEK